MLRNAAEATAVLHGALLPDAVRSGQLTAGGVRLGLMQSCMLSSAATGARGHSESIL